MLFIWTRLLSDYDHYNVEKSTSNKILVFDYDGNNVACFNLGCRIQEMAILPQGQKMYGLTQYPDFLWSNSFCRMNYINRSNVKYFS